MKHGGSREQREGETGCAMTSPCGLSCPRLCRGDLPGIEGSEAVALTIGHHAIKEGVGVCDEGKALHLTDGRRGGEEDGREGEGEGRSELVEVKGEGLTSGVVTRTEQQHVLDGVERDGSGWVRG